jgi:hypothetical protein
MEFSDIKDISLSADPPVAVALSVMRQKPEVLVEIFEKTYFFTKISCTYTMNFLRQEKCLRDHEGIPGMTCPL